MVEALIDVIDSDFEHIHSALYSSHANIEGSHFLFYFSKSLP